MSAGVKLGPHGASVGLSLCAPREQAGPAAGKGRRSRSFQRTARIVINDMATMGERRKPIPSTNVFAFDDEGNKYQLSARDFGARHQERLGSHVRGIAAPPPTQFIQIPIQARLMTADDVLRDMIQERRSISAQAMSAWRKLVELLTHTLMVVDRWFF